MGHLLRPVIGYSALYDEGSGRPIDFDDRERSRIVAMVCSKPPRGFYR